MIKTTVQEIVSGIIAKKEENGITAQQIADLSRVSKSTVDRLLRNDTNFGIGAQYLFDIASAVGYKICAPEEDPAIQRIVDVYESRIRQTEIQHSASQKRQSRWMLGVAVFAAAILIFVLCMLFYDLKKPGIGWVRE